MKRKAIVYGNLLQSTKNLALSWSSAIMVISFKKSRITKKMEIY
jgi:RNA polymerase subunit RPABC4/transcription elongation factor Spt4